MNNYWEVIEKAYTNYASYFWKSIVQPIFNGDLNYFYYLIFVSLFVWALEVLMPWRKNQKVVRKDFGLDTFYMFFNFFLANLFFFIALSEVTSVFINDTLTYFGLNNSVLLDLSSAHWLTQLLIYFLLADLIQWSVHNALHRIPFLWRFHKVHHSVKEMGFAAHLRFHFMESVFYKSTLYILLSVLFGFKLEYAFVLHAVTILIGHLNHANLSWDYGIFKYLLNNPKMHIWHHSKELPESHKKGMNFGISLSVWDYIFRTNYVPYDGATIELGFENDDDYPKHFFAQLIDPFRVKKTKNKDR
ncbi:MAG: sterol desaturase family protein [Lishizhenia sp.]